MRRLILHIGMHKTGTSAIQQALATTPLPGMHFIAPRGKPNASLIVLQALSHRFPAQSARNPGPASLDRITATRRAAMAALESALAAVPGADTGLLSGEIMSQLATDEVRLLRDIARAHTPEMTALAYVRAPASLAASAFQQGLRRRMLDRDMTFRYRVRLAPWERYFPGSALSLRVYDPARWPGGSVTGDFARRIGLAADSLPVAPRVNSALSRAAVGLLYCYRTHQPDEAPGDARIVARLARLDGPPLRFAASLVARFALPWRDEIDWVQERLGHAFPDPPETPGAVADLAELTAPDAATRDWLARETGTAVLPDAAPTERIAAIVRRLAQD